MTNNSNERLVAINVNRGKLGYGGYQPQPEFDANGKPIPTIIPTRFPSGSFTMAAANKQAADKSS